MPKSNDSTKRPDGRQRESSFCDFCPQHFISFFFLNQKSWKFSPYYTVTFSPHYKVQQINAVCGNAGCLSLESHKAHK